ncbi:type II toxin-antitoxin system HipA family toxin [Aliarcobacter cryaerophilus]|uniref:type II toxin-antitoxin system HipA family toxin n=1 Tax=Aliarcobacter cryaerophilus TaxID=28198 RepID=UPI003DA3A1B1
MKIFVVKNKQFFGTLSQVSEKIRFVYSDKIPLNSYLQGLQEKENISNTLFPIFENMLPEFEQVNFIKAQNNISNEIEVLLYLSDIHGSYEFYKEDDFYKLKQKEQNIFHFNDLQEEILDNNYTFPNILEYSLDIDESILYPNGLANSKVIGLSGYQYKFSIIKDDDKEAISYDTSKSSNYFMKPYSKYYTTYAPNDKNRSYIPYLLINEHLFMSLARDFGFSVPYNAIIKHGSDYHYIIKRFDRYGELKIDHHELLTLMNKNSDQKYKVTMNDVMETAKEYISKEQLVEFFRFILFSVVIGHGDLHAKNLSLIYTSNKFDEKSMQLSPFYDISTTKIYKDTKVNDVGLKIGNKTSKLKKADLLQLASWIDISTGLATNLIEQTSKQFIDSFESYIEKLPANIKALPYHTSKYGGQKPFEVVLKEYYKNQVESINKNILLIDTHEDIWN